MTQRKVASLMTFALSGVLMFGLAATVRAGGAGDAAKGKDVFEGNMCAQCHNITGAEGGVQAIERQASFQRLEDRQKERPWKAVVSPSSVHGDVPSQGQPGLAVAEYAQPIRVLPEARQDPQP